MFVALGTMFLASCFSGEHEIGGGAPSEVRFTLSLDSRLDVRGVDDGSYIDRLHYALFSEDGELVIPHGCIERVAGIATAEGFDFNLSIARAGVYRAVFWAQSSLCDSYTLSDDMKLTVDYSGANNNNYRDAFYGVTEKFDAKDGEIAVTLRRPFAQVNVGAFPSDWEYVRDGYGHTLCASEATIKGVPNEMDLMSGAVSGSADATFAMSDFPTESLQVDVDDNGVKESYMHLSMSYVLASTEQTTHEMLFRFSDGGGYFVEFNRGCEAVGIKRNWRTNIVGQVLAEDGRVYIKFDPAYDVTRDYAVIAVPEYYQNIAEDTTISNTIFNLTSHDGGAQFGSVDGQKTTLENVMFTGSTWVIELGEYRGSSYVNYNNELHNCVVQDLSVSCGIECHEWYFSPAVIAYGKSVFNHCHMTGTTTVCTHDNKGVPHDYIPCDLGIRNESDAVINGGYYGTIFAWTHAVVEIYDAMVDKLYCGTCDSTKHSWMTIGAGTYIEKVICCEPRKPYGTKEYSTTMTIKAGAKVGSIELVSTDVEFLIIEEGAIVNAIYHQGTRYTYEELRSAMGL
jgi:hypothetical protein